VKSSQHLICDLPISLFDGLHFVKGQGITRCHKNNENPPPPPPAAFHYTVITFFCWHFSVWSQWFWEHFKRYCRTRRLL